MSDLSPAVADQIKLIRLEPKKPLLLCDADEVLLQFLRGVEMHLEDEGYYLDLKSFALSGNIKHASSHEAASQDQVKALLSGFFGARMKDMSPVTGAADALASLAQDVQIVILTNTPPKHRAARMEVLARHGMDYPLVANEGSKGGAAKALASQIDAPVVFIDDIPHNIDAVLASVRHAEGIHFVADERLRLLIPKATSALHRVDEWHLAEPLIRDVLLG